jgi:HSP20 family protein
MKSIKELVSNAVTRFRPAPAHPFEKQRFPEAGPAWGLLAGDVHEEADRITVRLEVPGMEAKDFDVRVEGRRLVVSGEKRSEKRSGNGRYSLLECAYGSFERAIELPAEVLADKVKANYRRGVLDIELPKAQRSEPKRIDVKVHAMLGAALALAALTVPQRAQAALEYPLELQFQERDTAGKRVLYDVPVTITDMDGKVVYEGKSTGPYFVVRLPKGRYVVTTRWDDWTFSRTVTVDEKDRDRVVFSWDRSPTASTG